MTFTFELCTDKDENEFASNFENGNKNDYHDLCGNDQYKQEITKSQPWTENGYSIQEVNVTFRQS